MSQNIDYKAILKAYPETISKEQLYKLCHISKRMAKFYLDNGMIACTNTGHSTHKYIIRTSDAVAFLRDREKHPDRYRVTGVGGAGREPIVHPSINYDQAVMRAYQRLLVRKISVYPDLMTAAAISQLTGYSKNVSNGLKFFNRVSSSACPPPTAFINNQNLNRRFDDVGQAEGVELVLLYVNT